MPWLEKNWPGHTCNPLRSCRWLPCAMGFCQDFCCLDSTGFRYVKKRPLHPYRWVLQENNLSLCVLNPFFPVKNHAFQHFNYNLGIHSVLRFVMWRVSAHMGSDCQVSGHMSLHVTHHPCLSCGCLGKHLNSSVLVDWLTVWFEWILF